MDTNLGREAVLGCDTDLGRYTVYLRIYATLLRSNNEPKTRGAIYTRGTNIIEVSYLQSMIPGPSLWV